MHPQQFWLEFSLEKRNSGISLLLFGSFCAFHCSVRSEQDAEQFHSIFCSVLQDLAIRNGIILENHNCSAYTVKPSQNAINGIQESNFDVWVTVGVCELLCGGGDLLTWWATALHLGVLRVFAIQSPPGLAVVWHQLVEVVHPTEILVAILLASAAGWDFQDSGSNSKNLPPSWQLFR